MTDPEPTPGDPPWTATDVKLLPWLEVAPGIRRRSLPSCRELDVWLIEFDAHSRWPDVDHHLDVEEVLVLEGEFIDCGHSYGAGTFLHFEPGTSHQPRTETGGRMFGYNFVPGERR